MRSILAKPLVVAAIASAFTTCASGQSKNNGDALTNLLTTIGFSNIPYNQQSSAKVGNLIESSSNPYDGSIFHKPQSDFIKAVPSEGNTTIPAGKIEKAANAGIELDLFGFQPSIEFSNYKTLSYTAMSATSVEVDLDDAQANLNAPGSKTDAYLRPAHVEVRKPKFGGSARPYFDATYYIVTKLYIVTASGDITNDSGLEIAATSGPIPACKLPSDSTGSSTGTGKGTGTGTGTGTSTGAGTGTGTGTGTGKSTGTNAGKGDSGTLTVDGVTVNGGTTSSGGTQAKTATAASGGVHFCKKNDGSVHFDAAHPFPAMMDVAVLNLDPATAFKTWKLVPRVVGFYPPKPTASGDRP